MSVSVSTGGMEPFLTDSKLMSNSTGVVLTSRKFRHEGLCQLLVSIINTCVVAHQFAIGTSSTELCEPLQHHNAFVLSAVALLQEHVQWAVEGVSTGDNHFGHPRRVYQCGM